MKKLIFKNKMKLDLNEGHCLTSLMKKHRFLKLWL